MLDKLLLISYFLMPAIVGGALLVGFLDSDYYQNMKADCAKLRAEHKRNKEFPKAKLVNAGITIKSPGMGVEKPQI